MAIVTPRRREIELVKEAAERVAHRTRSKFVWNDKPPENEGDGDERQGNSQKVADRPVQFG